MIYDSGTQGVYMFLFCSKEDAPSDADYWYETVADAELHAAEFGLRAEDWQVIPDPAPGSQDDRLTV
jgi:hypothetical protein